MTTKAPSPRSQGMRFDGDFCPQGTDPFKTVEWEERTALIEGRDGTEVFRQDKVLTPKSWSQMATNVVASKYLYGDAAKGERETSIGSMISRVAGMIAIWGNTDGYFQSNEDADRFRDDLTHLVLHQCGSFNSPVWFNVGLSQCYGIKGSKGNFRWSKRSSQVISCDDSYRYPQASACFIQSVDDDMTSIMALATSEAMLFKHGSGTGTDLSTLRSSREKLQGGGTPSGPVSFMRIYDAIAGVIKSGGKTRRAAKMQTLKAHHPDIMAFVTCKPGEEAKAHALMAAGFTGGMDGQAATAVGFQNANLSVRVTGEFMDQASGAVGQVPLWDLIAVTTGDVIETVKASDILDAIADGTWKCGDPGIQYEDAIQAWHTCPNTAPINSSNPCGEFTFLDDTACNLASLNLMKFLTPDGGFDVDRFRKAVRIFLTAQEILVDRASYPTALIAENSHRFRPLGLGYANLGGLIMSMGMPYDSDDARSLAGAITAIMHGEANLTSIELAEVKGPFEGYSVNRGPMIEVMAEHYRATRDDGYSKGRFKHLWDLAAWLMASAVDRGNSYGFRNAQVTLLAPTGTIAFMMDADTTGIEPALALVQYKNLAGGGQLKITNRIIPMALEALGYEPGTRASIISDFNDDGDIYASQYIADEHFAVFDCAFPSTPGGRSIAWQGHVRMMAAVQPFLSGAISKTINMPNDATVADIRDAYLLGWKLGLKSLAIYRDGSKGSQPVGTKAGHGESIAAEKDESGFPPDFNGPRIDDLWQVINDLMRSEESLKADNLKLSLCLTDMTQASLSQGMDIKALKAVIEGMQSSHPAPRRERLPATRRSLTHKFQVQGHEGYMTVGFFPDGRPGELFVKMSKEGSTLQGLMDAIGTVVSLGLQYGLPLEILVRKMAHARYEPAGFTGDTDIPMASSLTDYVFRKLGCLFLPEIRAELTSTPDPMTEAPAPVAINGEGSLGPPNTVEIQELIKFIRSRGEATPPQAPEVTEAFRGAADIEWSAETIRAGLAAIPLMKPVGKSVAAPYGSAQATAPHYADGPACDICGSLTVRSGSCHRCPNCGNSMGCS